MDFPEGALSYALAEWQGLLGTKYVDLDTERLAAASMATFGTRYSLLGILRPGSRDEVQGCMRVATKWGVPVYPVSGGRNWGLGSMAPAGPGGVLLDLGRLKGITGYDAEMATVNLEPGVTFADLHAFLEARGDGLMVDGIGGSPHASVIGNTVERGHGTGLYADRFAHVCGMEVVLPDGRLVYTGYRQQGADKLGNLGHWGLGPYLDGLFTQSALGVVTGLSLWLRPRSAFFQVFSFQVDSPEVLASVTDRVRGLRLGGLATSFRIFNDYRYISIQRGFPFDLADGNGALPDAERLALRRSSGGVGAFTGLGALYPQTAAEARAQRRLVCSRLGRGVRDLHFYTPGRRGLWGLRRARNRMADFMYSRSSLNGYLTEQGVNMCYWRRPIRPEDRVDVHTDGCGVIWYCPIVPARGRDLVRATAIIEELSALHGFEPNLGYLFIQDRVVDLTGAICYDRTVAGADEAAMACHDAIMDGLAAEGYPPYRLGLQSMGRYAAAGHGSSLSFVADIKGAADPAGIFAPGRYPLPEKVVL